jgi:large subunit ribosomal protein L2
MALKSYKPTTPGQRGLVLIDRSELWKGRPVKSLTEGLSKKGGRNNTGRITMRRKGGGAKRLYRIVDFKRTQVRRPGDGRADRIRSQPHRLHRADPL